MARRAGRDVEDEATRAIADIVGAPPEGEVWIGDDTAVLARRAPSVLFATDALVEHVHFERRLCLLEDVGYKALSVNVSDVAAMGGTPTACVVAVTGATLEDLKHLYVGLYEASTDYRTSIVGGDLCDGSELVVSLSVLGDANGAPVLRSGARPGDVVFVTGPLGGSAAGLRALHQDRLAVGDHVDAYRRPIARVQEGALAARSGASAMIDISDGLSIDLFRLVQASKVGVEVTEVPIASRASTKEALYGGEDYELLFTAPDRALIEKSFSDEGLELPYVIGSVLKDQQHRTLLGEELTAKGYMHRLSNTGTSSPGAPERA